jgi:hypothetical protein
MVRTSVSEKNRSQCRLNAGTCPQNRRINVHEVVVDFILVSSEHFERESEYAFDCHQIYAVPAGEEQKEKHGNMCRYFHWRLQETQIIHVVSFIT